MFTRQHYKAIAEILKNEIIGDDSRETFITVHNIATELVEYFTADNPRFDFSRFYKACGSQEDE